MSGRGCLKKIVVGLLPALMLAGCGYMQSPAELLGAPRPADAEAEAAAAVRALLPSKSRLTLPEEGADASAVRLADMDGDGSEEAIAGYIRTDSYDSYGLIVATRTEGKWRSLASLRESSGGKLQWLSTLTAEGGREWLLAGWGSGASEGNRMQVYGTEDGRFRLLQELEFGLAGTGDVDGDGAEELVLVSGNERASRAMVYEPDGNGVVLRASVGFAAANGFERLYIGPLSDRTRGIAVESLVGGHASTTALLAWEDGALRAYEADADDPDGSVLFKSRAAYNEDVDGDGVLDIHRLLEPAGTAGMAKSDREWLHEWHVWNGGGQFRRAAVTYDDPASHYRYFIPDEWDGRYTIGAEEGDECVTTSFYARDGATGVGGPAFFALTACLEESWARVQADNVIGKTLVLQRYGGRVVAAVWPEAPEGATARQREELAALRPTDSEAIASFVLLPPRRDPSI